MATISPDSEIYILKNVPFDKSYNHTVKWTSATVQHDTLLGQNSNYVKYVLTSQSYQRWKRDYIRVDKTCDDLYDCNYLAFRNSTTGGKWFYAFLDEPEYINNNCSQLHYTIDVMQTWMFDFTVPPCFVEREHAISDGIGENVVSENVDIGSDYISPLSLTKEHKDTILFGYVILAKSPAYAFTYRIAVGGDTYRYNLSTRVLTQNAPAGVPAAGGVILYGFPVTADEAKDFADLQNLFLMQDVRVYRNGSYDPAATQVEALNLNTFMSHIRAGNIPTEDGQSQLSADDVIAVGLYPHYLNYRQYYQSAYKLQMTVDNTLSLTSMTVPAGFYDSNFSPTTAQTPEYTPKNNKLKTYPYMRLYATNNRGSSTIYRYEDFKDGNAKFKVYGTWAYSPTEMLVPVDYLGQSDNFNETITYTDFPAYLYLGSQFTSWLESNKYSFNFSMLSGAINSIMAISQNPTKENIRSTAINAGVNIGERLANIADMKNAAPPIYGQITNDVFNTGFERPQFSLYPQTIKPQFARIIDDYLSMTGYATKKVKIPNVFNGSSTRRSQWNYLKTIGAHIKSTNNGIPAADIDLINKIMDNGITFWYNISNVGNYALTNNIITG